MRTRGGSKTFDMMKVLLYYAYSGFTAYFWCSLASQMKQPMKYLHTLCNHTFLKYAYDHLLLESVTFKNGGSLDILNLTEDTARSRRGDISYYDELARADEKAFHASEPVLSVSKLAKTIYGSTPAKGTIFETIVKRLESEHKVVLRRKWDECTFIDREFIDRQKASTPGWFFRQEYECSFEAPQGLVFTNVIFGNFTLPDMGHPVNFGVDWNPVSGHYIEGSVWSTNFLSNYAVYEENLGTNLDKVFERLVTILELNPQSYMEIEDGGTNTGYCDSFYKYIRDNKKHVLFQRLSRREWDSGGKNKMQSITTLLPIVIFSRESTKANDLADWLGKAHWAEETEQPQLEKDPNQHALDAYLHSSWVGRSRPALQIEFVSK